MSSAPRGFVSRVATRNNADASKKGYLTTHRKKRRNGTSIHAREHRRRSLSLPSSPQTREPLTKSLCEHRYWELPFALLPAFPAARFDSAGQSATGRRSWQPSQPPSATNRFVAKFLVVDVCHRAPQPLLGGGVGCHYSQPRSPSFSSSLEPYN